MDTAVALVQTYLHANGYLTVTEYPLVETLTRGQVRSRTDLDIIAFRFAGASGGGGSLVGGMAEDVDPALAAPAANADMIIGEVKEGAARFNPAMRDPDVLSAAVIRFGCCPADASEELVRRLLSRGSAVTPHGHHVRMVAFGSVGAAARMLPGQHVVELGHVVQFLQQHIAAHREVMHASEPHDPVLALLALLDKAGLGRAG